MIIDIFFTKVAKKLIKIHNCRELTKYEIKNNIDGIYHKKLFLVPR